MSENLTKLQKIILSIVVATCLVALYFSYPSFLYYSKVTSVPQGAVSKDPRGTIYMMFGPDTCVGISIMLSVEKQKNGKDSLCIGYVKRRYDESKINPFQGIQ